jgi:hypothetical protein
VLHLGSTVLRNAEKPFSGSGGFAQTVYYPVAVCRSTIPLYLSPGSRESGCREDLAMKLAVDLMVLDLMVLVVVVMSVVPVGDEEGGRN